MRVPHRSDYGWRRAGLSASPGWLPERWRDETTDGPFAADAEASIAVEFDEPLVADAEVMCDLVEHDVLDLAV